jgi:hypothetical protein
MSLEQDTHHLASSLFARPLDLPAAPHELLHPQPDTRRKAHSQGYQALESATKHLSNDDGDDEYPYAEYASALLHLCEHGLVADRGRGVEQDVGLLAMDGHVGCCALGDRIRGSCDILGFFVVCERLVGVRLDGLAVVSLVYLIEAGYPYRLLVEIGIGDVELWWLVGCLQHTWVVHTCGFSTSSTISGPTSEMTTSLPVVGSVTVFSVPSTVLFWILWSSTPSWAGAAAVAGVFALAEGPAPVLASIAASLFFLSLSRFSTNCLTVGIGLWPE